MHVCAHHNKGTEVLARFELCCIARCSNRLESLTFAGTLTSLQRSRPSTPLWTGEL